MWKHLFEPTLLKLSLADVICSVAIALVLVHCFGWRYSFLLVQPIEAFPSVIVFTVLGLVIWPCLAVLIVTALYHLGKIRLGRT